MLYACDGRWWDVHHAAVRREFAGELWTQDEKAAVAFRLHRVTARWGRGFCGQPGVVFTGANSTFQALTLAVQWGASEVALIGVDMQNTGGRTHWHGDHAKPMRNDTPFSQCMQHFGELARDLAMLGVRVVNCTAVTALRCFPRERWGDYLARIRADTAAAGI